MKMGFQVLPAADGSCNSRFQHIHDSVEQLKAGGNSFHIVIGNLKAASSAGFVLILLKIRGS